MQRFFSAVICFLVIPMLFSGCATTAPVSDAADYGDIGQVKQLLAQGYDINEPGMVGFTALHNASYDGNLEMVELLLKNKADPNTDSAMGGRTPLMIAINRNHIEIVKMLIRYGADVNKAQEGYKLTPLMWAAYYNRQEIAKILLDSGADINRRDNKGKTAMDCAVDRKFLEIQAVLSRAGARMTYTGDKKKDLTMAGLAGDREKIVSLLNQGADPNVKDKAGNTLLMHAVKGDWPEVLALLLEKGADPTVRDKNGFTAQMLAALDSKTELLDIFEEAGVAKPYTGNAKEDLLVAVLFSDYEKARMLLKNGGDVNSRFRFNSPLLNYAVNRNDAAGVRLLLENKADPNLFNDHGWNPISIAALKDNTEILELLLNNGGDPGRANNQGRTALMTALWNKKPGAARLLLEKTTDMNVRDSDGISLLFYSILSGDQEIARQILARGAQPDLSSVVLADGRNIKHKTVSAPEIAALIKPEFLRRQMLRAQAAVEAAQSAEDYKQAIAEYNLAKDIDPNVAEIYYNLGLIQDKAGNYNGAIASLRKYLQLSPDAPDFQSVQDLIYKIEYKRDSL